MPSPAGPFKTAQDAALRASSALQAAMGLGSGIRLYTEVPAGALLPYAVIGEDQVIADTTGCAGDYELISTVQWWSRPAGALDRGAQARAMGSAICDALNLELILAGFVVDDWECQSESYSTDPDQSAHGRAVFRYLLTEIVA